MRKLRIVSGLLPCLAVLALGLGHRSRATAAAPAGAGSAAPVTVTIGAARLLDIDNGHFIERPLVRIDSGVITEVRTRLPGEPVTFELGDQTLLPGLIDCHTHLVGGEGQTPYDALRETAAHAAIEGVANARATIAAGFTTVRDLGSRDFADVALRDLIAAGRVAGPRMFVAVSSISATGGHGDYNDLPPDVVIQRYRAIADGPEEVQKAVRTNLKLGADWIKILVTGGVTSPGTDPQQTDYGEDEIRAAVQAAAVRGKDVAAHAHGAIGIIRAARAGVRSIEHASFLTDEAIAEVRRAGAFLVPNPYTNLFILERGRAGGFLDYEIEKSRVVFQRKLDSVRRAVAAGIPVAYGTDSGVQPHGLNGRQLALLVQAGMTPLQALQSATLTAARLLRQERRLGRLRPGYFGDVVAVPGDPLRDLRLVEAPSFVFKEGQLLFARTGPVLAEPLPQNGPPHAPTQSPAVQRPPATAPPPAPRPRPQPAPLPQAADGVWR